MRIEFKTVYNQIVNEKLGNIYVQHFMEDQIKKFKFIRAISIIAAVISCVIGVLLQHYYLVGAGLAYVTFVCLVISKTTKKALPKSFVDANGVGCPYNVTFGFYDEYFYEKFEGNMSITESSIRYEFLKKIVEMPDCFVLMSKRSQLFYLPKSDMGYENTMAFTAFCKSRLPYIYKVVN